MKRPSQIDQQAAKGLSPESTTPPTENEYVRYVRDQKNGEIAPANVPASVNDGDFIAVDEKMLRIKEIIDQIAGTNVQVLITGESGTGKEVVAQAIHKRSNRANKPFVAVNCAALPSSLLESELFGFEKGAFTGAHQRHVGKFEQAHMGTLLLDEVTEIDPQLQAKLLRVLQEREIERIGGSGPVQVDVRIIATTNRDIVSSVSQGSFRQDLYYRLYVIHLEVPPLRERRADVEVLAKHFVKLFAISMNKPGLELSSDAINRLQAHSWPGNVRELQNVIQRSVLMANGSNISAKDIRIEVGATPASDDWVKHLPVGKSLQEVETQFILETLKHHQGNRTHAAKTLAISLRTLRNKINEFSAGGIQVIGPQNAKVLGDFE